MKTFSEFNNINENINFTNEADSGLEGVRTFKNGLSVEIIKEKYPWLMQAKFKDAVIGQDRDGFIVWYKGTWIDGTWENGTWFDGEWESGIWEDGVWVKGTWKNGNWKSGTWENGIWQDGEWDSGFWFDGTWENGSWIDGDWKRGRWRGEEILNQETGEFEKSDEPPTEDFD